MPSLLDAQSAPKRLTIANLIYLCVCTGLCRGKKPPARITRAKPIEQQLATNQKNWGKKCLHTTHIIYYLWRSFFLYSGLYNIEINTISICYQRHSIWTIFFCHCSADTSHFSPMRCFFDRLVYKSEIFFSRMGKLYFLLLHDSKHLYCWTKWRALDFIFCNVPLFLSFERLIVSIFRWKMAASIGNTWE